MAYYFSQFWRFRSFIVTGFFVVLNFTPQLGQFGWFGHGIMRMNAAALFALLGAAQMVISWQRNVSLWSLSRNTMLAFIFGLFLLVLIGFNSSRTQFWLQSNHL